jgi:tetratricopeptide (TPR) repeat protein
MFNNDNNKKERTSCLTLDDLIAYSQGSLASHERERIQRHAAHCNLCSDAMIGISASPNNEDVRPIIESLQQDIHRRTTQLAGKKRNWRIYYRAAALLLIALSSLLYLFSQKSPHEALFEKYFRPYPNTIPITRGENSEMKLKQGLAEYEFENYEQAAIILEEVINSEPGNSVAHFYLGISLLFLNHPDQAISNFQDVIQIGNNEFVEHANWYLGLSFLKKGELDQAKIIFRNWQSEKQRYEQQTKELLNSLEKMPE